MFEGEVVKFGDIKNGKTQLVTFGATPSKRIS
jgi:hypothetical protein